MTLLMPHSQGSCYLSLINWVSGRLLMSGNWFFHQFSINQKYPKITMYLFTISQKEEESWLCTFVQHFSEAVYEVPHVNHELLVEIMQQNLRYERIKDSMAGRPPVTLEEYGCKWFKWTQTHYYLILFKFLSSFKILFKIVWL